MWTKKISARKISEDFLLEPSTSVFSASELRLFLLSGSVTEKSKDLQKVKAAEHLEKWEDWSWCWQLSTLLALLKVVRPFLPSWRVVDLEFRQKCPTFVVGGARWDETPVCDDGGFTDTSVIGLSCSVATDNANLFFKKTAATSHDCPRRRF